MNSVSANMTIVVSLLIAGAGTASAQRTSTTSMERRSRHSPTQDHVPGSEWKMDVKPLPYSPFYKPAGKLLNRVALITGADSGIGRAVAIHFCLEGADVAIACLEEEMQDAYETKRLCAADMDALVDEMIKIVPEAKEDFLAELKTVRPRIRQSKVIIVTGDISNSSTADHLVQETTSKLGKIDILVNNAGQYFRTTNFFDITNEQFQHIMQTNIFGAFYLTKVVAKQMTKNDAIINTASVAAYNGLACSVDYCTSKGAVVGFTRGLSSQLVNQGIRVNAVAPGRVWTPFSVSGWPTSTTGEITDQPAGNPMGRAGDTCELAPSYVFLASFDSNFMTGQVLHPNGGTVVNG